MRRKCSSRPFRAPVVPNATVTGAAAYEAAFKSPAKPYYVEVVTSLLGRTPFLAGDLVANTRGVILFVPPTIAGLVPEPALVRFGYRYRHPISGALSSEALSPCASHRSIDLPRCSRRNCLLLVPGG
jgi:hypothetical protein